MKQLVRSTTVDDPRVLAAVLQCVTRLQERADVLCAFVGGSAATQQSHVNDLDICIVVREGRHRRLRRHFGGIVHDLFIDGLENLRNDLRRGRRQHIIMLYATGRYVLGDRVLADEIQRIARGVAAEKPPPPTNRDMFRFRGEPFDLLRKYESLSMKDAYASAVVLSRLVSTCVDCYFALNREWNLGIGTAMDRLRKLNPEGAEALSRVLERSSVELAEDPKLVETMVRLLAGDEPYDEIEPGRGDLTANAAFARPGASKGSFVV